MLWECVNCGERIKCSATSIGDAKGIRKRPEVVEASRYRRGCCEQPQAEQNNTAKPTPAPLVWHAAAAESLRYNPVNSKRWGDSLLRFGKSELAHQRAPLLLLGFDVRTPSTEGVSNGIGNLQRSMGCALAAWSRARALCASAHERGLVKLAGIASVSRRT